MKTKSNYKSNRIKYKTILSLCSDMVYKVYKEYCDYENQKVKERLKEIAKNERNRSGLV